MIKGKMKELIFLTAELATCDRIFPHTGAEITIFQPVQEKWLADKQTSDKEETQIDSRKVRQIDRMAVIMKCVLIW